MEYEDAVMDDAGPWKGHSNFTNENYGVTTIEYDNCFDLMWMGHANGRVASYSIVSDHNIGDSDTNEQYLPSIVRYSSFVAANDVVLQLLPNHSNIVCVCGSKINARTYGGLSIGSINLNDVGLSDSSVTFTCGDLIRSPTVSRFSSSFISASVIAGTSTNWAFMYDLSVIHDAPLMTFDVVSPSVKIQSNGHLMAVAGYDGTLRLLDGKFRSSEVLCSMQAHFGTIKDFCLQSDGRTLVTCGVSSLSSGYQYNPDPQIKVFDLRMQRQLNALPVSLSDPSSGVRFVRFLHDSYAEVSDGSVATSIALVSDAGAIQISDLLSDGSIAPQTLYTPFVDPSNEYVMACGVASSGQFLSVGTSHGSIAQYIHHPDLEHPEQTRPPVRVNENSPNVKISPLAAPPPLMSLPPDALVLGTAYTLRPPRLHEEHFLSSSYQTTPHILKKRMQLSSAKIISDDLLRTMARHDFIGIIPNPGCAPNSMIYALPGRSVAYANSDPRRQHEHSPRGAGDRWARSPGAAQWGDGASSTPLDSLLLPPVAGGGTMPAQFRCQKSALGKQQRYMKFKYATCNKTPFVGLENNLPNSFLNALLQVLYNMGSLRAYALRAQLSSYHHQENNQTTLWCELGFLFHMMQRTEASSEQYRVKTVTNGSGEIVEVEKMVRPANFQRTFQTYQLLPEVAALGLFDEAQHAKDLQLVIQSFVQFLLRQLSKEAEAEHKSRPITSPTAQAGGRNVVDDLLGFSVRSSTAFLHSGTLKLEPQPSRSLLVELVYPSLIVKQTLKPGSAVSTGVKKISASFAAVLWSSFQKEIFMKGWCKESESYEPFKKMQAVESLPLVLAILCGDTQRDVKEATLAGALGETQSQGNAHANFWSGKSPLSTSKWTSPATSGEGDSTVVDISWLPVELEIAYATSLQPLPVHSKKSAGKQIEGEKSVDATTSRLVVSCRCVQLTTGDAASGEVAPRWIIFDGNTERFATSPASQLSEYRVGPSHCLAEDNMAWAIVSFDLSSVVSQVAEPETDSLKHVVVHIVKPTESKPADVAEDGIAAGPAPSKSTLGWFLFNDFAVSPVTEESVVVFADWRHPCAVFFAQRSEESRRGAVISLASKVQASIAPLEIIAVPEKLPEYIVPQSVLHLESLSHIPCIRTQSFATLPGRGDLIAFDGEFVSVALEKSDMSSAGQRVVHEEGRQVLARISLLDAGQVSPSGAVNAFGEFSSSALVGGGGGSIFNKNMMRILADDYVLPIEPVLDYVTRFSGITEDDLNPHTSKHAVVTHRTAYLKLRYFLDRGCVFVGHGLDKDFEIANIFIPPEQVRDTVDLWRLPKQRKISLRFLASYLLKEDIQDEIHDSIEDAKTALLLYRHYESTAARGPEHLAATLRDLYEYGNKNNWTLGLDRLK